MVLGAPSNENKKITDIKIGIKLGKRPMRMRGAKLELQKLTGTSSGRLCSWVFSEPLWIPLPLSRMDLGLRMAPFQ